MAKKRKQPSRGGRRPGAGRKRMDPAGNKRPVTVWVSPTEEDHLEKLGGTAAGGLRRLLAESLHKGGNDDVEGLRQPDADSL